jgi:NAD kinase
MNSMKLRRYDMLGEEDDIKAVSHYLGKAPSHFIHDQDVPEFHIVVGGDGAILFKDIKKRILDGKPILHVHYKKGSTDLNDKKSLGFTSDLTPRDIPKALDDIAKGRFFIKRIRLLNCSINSKIRGVAINDISITPKESFSTLLFSAMLEIKETGQNETLPSPKCDLLLISTRQGSTAWNVSVGGAINIDVENCTHMNFVDSPILQSHYVYESKDMLHLNIYTNALIGIDAHNLIFRIKKGDRIDISEAEKHISFLHTNSTFESLMQKIRRQNKFNLDGITG